MVSINAFFFQKNFFHLFSHYSFTPSVCLHSYTIKKLIVMFFSPFKMRLPLLFREPAVQPHYLSYISPLALFFLSSHTPVFVILAVHFFFSVFIEGYMKAAAVFLKGQIKLKILKLLSTYINLQFCAS